MHFAHEAIFYKVSFVSSTQVKFQGISYLFYSEPSPSIIKNAVDALVGLRRGSLGHSNEFST